jgi:hypothetical protein
MVLHKFQNHTNPVTSVSHNMAVRRQAIKQEILRKGGYLV